MASKSAASLSEWAALPDPILQIRSSSHSATEHSARLEATRSSDCSELEMRPYLVVGFLWDARCRLVLQGPVGAEGGVLVTQKQVPSHRAPLSGEVGRVNCEG
jgi:hypothetical protein